MVIGDKIIWRLKKEKEIEEKSNENKIIKDPIVIIEEKLEEKLFDLGLMEDGCFLSFFFN